MRIHPFKALRRTPESAPNVASAPYDVVDRAEASRLATGKPDSFLRVVRSEIELDGVDAYDDAVYRRAAGNLAGLKTRGALVEEAVPSLYAYRISSGDHSQTGLLTCLPVDDYEAGLIKKHELTRQDKEDDRTRHIEAIQAQAGPVLVTCRDHAPLHDVLAAVLSDTPLLSADSETGERHEIWPLPDVAAVERACADIPASYIADGHHRSASAARVRALCRERNSDHNGTEEYNFFLAVVFPVSQLRILAYNRVIKDLGALTLEDVLAKAASRFDICEVEEGTPLRPLCVRLYSQGRWRELVVKSEFFDASDAVRSLDCSVLQEHFIEPVLGIRDVRTDPRIGFVGGSLGTTALENAVDNGQAAMALSMYPTSIEQLMGVADADQIMPPKSTWFDPKLRSGLVVHAI